MEFTILSAVGYPGIQCNLEEFFERFHIGTPGSRRQYGMKVDHKLHPHKTEDGCAYVYDEMQPGSGVYMHINHPNQVTLDTYDPMTLSDIGILFSLVRDIQKGMQAETVAFRPGRPILKVKNIADFREDYGKKLIAENADQMHKYIIRVAYYPGIKHRVDGYGMHNVLEWDNSDNKFGRYSWFLSSCQKNDQKDENREQVYKALFLSSDPEEEKVVDEVVFGRTGDSTLRNDMDEATRLRVITLKALNGDMILDGLQEERDERLKRLKDAATVQKMTEEYEEKHDFRAQMVGKMDDDERKGWACYGGCYATIEEYEN